MNWESVGNDEDGDLLVRPSHSSYCHSKHHWGRVVECVIRSLDGDPYASGERGLSGGAGTQALVKL